MRIPHLTPAVALFATVLLVSTEAGAAVSLRNGNFSIGYTDIAFSGGFEPKIARVYNSKTGFKGIFGYGWGCDFEVHLNAEPDGSVTVTEYGGGAENIFSPPTFTALELQATVEDLSSLGSSRDGLKGKQLEDYRTRVRTDAQFRRDQWSRGVREGLLRQRDVPVGVRLVSNRFAYQYLVRLPDGYQRFYDNGRRERFDLQGRLVRAFDVNGNFIDLRYGSNGRPELIADNFGRTLRFEYNARNLVQRVIGDDGKGYRPRADYAYNAYDDLILSEDGDANRYVYEYSARHNMRRIGYTDGTDMVISYFQRDRGESVRMVKARDGTTTFYSYEADPQDAGHSTTATEVVNHYGKPLSRSSHEYFERRKSNGDLWLFRLITEIDGQRTETTYNECCGLPVEIVNGEGRALFEYDAQGRVTRKETPWEVNELAYSPHGKVSRVVRRSKSAPEDFEQANFEYDARGNLITASNSEGKRAELSYDQTGRIDTARIDDKVISFTYDTNSKPILIRLHGVGEIVVRYSPWGRIEKVESASGAAIASQVNSVFQTLLDIIRPADVSLSF